MTFALWSIYILGQLLTIWKRASLSAKSQFSPWNNLKEYVTGHGPQIGINFLLGTGLFWTVWHDTSFLAHMLQTVGISKDFDVPLNPFTAGIYGVASDSIIDLLTAKVLPLLGLAPSVPKQDPGN